MSPHRRFLTHHINGCVYVIIVRNFVNVSKDPRIQLPNLLPLKGENCLDETLSLFISNLNTLWPIVTSSQNGGPLCLGLLEKTKPLGNCTNVSIWESCFKNTYSQMQLVQQEVIVVD